MRPFLDPQRGIRLRPGASVYLARISEEPRDDSTGTSICSPCAPFGGVGFQEALRYRQSMCLACQTTDRRTARERQTSAGHRPNANLEPPSSLFSCFARSELDGVNTRNRSASRRRMISEQHLPTGERRGLARDSASRLRPSKGVQPSASQYAEDRRHIAPGGGASYKTGGIDQIQRYLSTSLSSALDMHIDDAFQHLRDVAHRAG